MVVESSRTVVCPVQGKQVRITDMYAVEAGGSCQMDIDVCEKSCSAQADCPGKTKEECLLQSDRQYPSRCN